MKRNLLQNVKWRHLMLIATAVGLQSCSKEETPLSSSTTDQPVAMRLSYELEAITHREIISAGQNTNLAFLDEIASEPVVDRQAVDILVFEDGSADYLIEKREPQRLKLPSPFEGVPLDDTPPIVKTKVTGGMAYFYGERDDLLYQHPVEENYAFLRHMDQLTGEYNWEAAAQAEGATLEQRGEGILLIRRPVVDEISTEGPALRSTPGRYTEEVILKSLNLLLKSSLREADGQLVSRMVNRHTYQEDQDQWVPEQVYYEEYGTDEATGSQYVSRTTYYYDNYSLQIN